MGLLFFVLRGRVTKSLFNPRIGPQYFAPQFPQNIIFDTSKIIFSQQAPLLTIVLMKFQPYLLSEFVWWRERLLLFYENGKMWVSSGNKTFLFKRFYTEKIKAGPGAVHDASPSVCKYFQLDKWSWTWPSTKYRSVRPVEVSTPEMINNISDMDLSDRRIKMPRYLKPKGYRIISSFQFCTIN